jgi:myosin heavy subunit
MITSRLLLSLPLLVTSTIYSTQPAPLATHANTTSPAAQKLSTKISPAVKIAPSLETNVSRAAATSLKDIGAACYNKLIGLFTGPDKVKNILLGVLGFSTAVFTLCSIAQHAQLHSQQTLINAQRHNIHRHKATITARDRTIASQQEQLTHSVRENKAQEQTIEQQRQIMAQRSQETLQQSLESEKRIASLTREINSAQEERIQRELNLSDLSHQLALEQTGHAFTHGRLATMHHERNIIRDAYIAQGERLRQKVVTLALSADNLREHKTHLARRDAMIADLVLPSKIPHALRMHIMSFLQPIRGEHQE